MSSTIKQAQTTQPISLSKLVNHALAMFGLSASIGVTTLFWLYKPASFYLLASSLPFVITLSSCAAVSLTYLIIRFVVAQNQRRNLPKNKMLKELKKRMLLVRKLSQFTQVKHKKLAFVTMLLLGLVLGGGVVGFCTGSQPLSFLSQLFSAPVVWSLFAFLFFSWAVIYGLPVVESVREAMFQNKQANQVQRALQTFRQGLMIHCDVSSKGTSTVAKDLHMPSPWAVVEQQQQILLNSAENHISAADGYQQVVQEFAELEELYFLSWLQFMHENGKVSLSTSDEIEEYFNLYTDLTGLVISNGSELIDIDNLKQRIESIHNIANRLDNDSANSSDHEVKEKARNVRNEFHMIQLYFMAQQEKVKSSKKSKFRFLKIFAEFVATFNIPVNGMGTLFGAAGCTALLMGHKGLILMPTWEKLAIAIISFAAGAIAAAVLTRRGILGFFYEQQLEKTAKQPQDETGIVAMRNTFKAKMTNSHKQHASEPSFAFVGLLLAFMLLGNTLVFTLGYYFLKPTSLFQLFNCPSVFWSSMSIMLLTLAIIAYQALPEGFIERVDGLIRKHLGVAFALTTATGLAFFQFYAGFHAIPEVLSWWNISASAPWIHYASWFLGIACLAVTIFAAMGFFLHFSQKDIKDFRLEQFYQGTNKQPSGKEQFLFYIVLPIVPTACTTYMIFNSLRTFPLFLKWFGSIPGITASGVSIICVTLASIVSFACFYLLYKVFMDFSFSVRSIYSRAFGSNKGASNTAVFADMGTRSLAATTLASYRDNDDRAINKLVEVLGKQSSNLKVAAARTAG